MIGLFLILIGDLCSARRAIHCGEVTKTPLKGVTKYEARVFDETLAQLKRTRRAKAKRIALDE
jgi:hypothetical protein